jgi:DNA-binding protein Fis
MSLEELEQLHIERVLQAVDGNRTTAARVLGIDRSTLYRKMQRIAPSDAKRD